MDLHLPFIVRSVPTAATVPLLRRQESLQAVLDYTGDIISSATPPATSHELAECLLLYSTVLEVCRRGNIPLSVKARTPLLHPFFFALHEHCPAPGKSIIVFVVRHALFPPALVPPGADRDYTDPLHCAPSAILPRARHWLQPTFSHAARTIVYSTLQTLADDLIRGFFVPLQAAGGQTPSSVSPLISPRSTGDVGSEQGTYSRLDGLRHSCLRCVVSRHLDWTAQTKHNRQHPDDLWDEDTVNTEVANIIPHSFNALAANGSLGPARDAIDSPRNAITLAGDLHKRFGRLKWYLEPTGSTPHCYTVHAVRGQRIEAWLRPPGGVVFFDADGEVPPPDPRFIALHRACCLILSMSGAGECADNVLQDMNELSGNGVHSADGSSDLAQYWNLMEIIGRV
ncbi:hypothetical protein Q9L58_009415, partial [Maublancomyces gigas]